MRFTILALLLSISLFAKQNFKVLIPLYSTPEYWFAQKDKFEKIKEKKLQVYAIINPNNGPGKEATENYIEGIRFLKEYDIKVIGYVYTLYGKREPFEVKEDIYKWSSFYQEFGLDGIFFDETSNKAKDLEFYKDLTTYTKTHDLNFNILNPGYTTDKSYLEENIAELIVSYENSFKAFRESFPKNLNKPTVNTKLSILLHTVPKEEFGVLMHDIKEEDFDFIYFTEDDIENPWDSFSQYLLNYF